MTLHLHIPEGCPERLSGLTVVVVLGKGKVTPLKKLKTGNISALHPPWLPVSETEKPEMSFDYFGGNRLFMFVLSVDLE